ncbi:helix-turn-helix domain-containing protein [Ensifer oleiphilus]|nr:helix-turn-helix domain-containing protein [Ensifer oleiphilus]
MQPETRHSTAGPETRQVTTMRPKGLAAGNGATDARNSDGEANAPLDGVAMARGMEVDAPVAAARPPENDATLAPEDLLGALSAHVKAQRLRVLQLELALADAEARILSQAQLLCGAGADGEGGLFSRRPVREIVDEVLLAYPGIGWADVIGVRRERRLVEPRHRCMAAVYDEREDLSLPALGRIFRRDHTSVLHAVNKGRAKR